MKEISLGKEIYVSIFNFSTITILFHCHLTYIVSNENPVSTLSFVPLSFCPGCSAGFLFAIGSKQFGDHVHSFLLFMFLCTILSACITDSWSCPSDSVLSFLISSLFALCFILNSFHYCLKFIFSSIIYNLPLIPSSVLFTLDITVFTSSSSIQVFPDIFSMCLLMFHLLCSFLTYWILLQ